MGTPTPEMLHVTDSWNHPGCRSPVSPSKHSPSNATMFTTNHILKCHIQGWGLHHCFGQPDHPLSEEFFPNIPIPWCTLRLFPSSFLFLWARAALDPFSIILIFLGVCGLTPFALLSGITPLQPQTTLPIYIPGLISKASASIAT